MQQIIVSLNIQNIVNQYQNSANISQIIKQLQQEKNHFQISNLVGSSLSFVISETFKKANKPYLLIFRTSVALTALSLLCRMRVR